MAPTTCSPSPSTAHVDEVGDRLGVERGVPAGDDDRVRLVAVGRVQRDAGQVERGEQVGVAELGGEADAEQVEAPTGRWASTVNCGDAVLAHQRLEVGPDGVGALGQRVGALVEHLVEDLHALVGQPHLVGVGVHQRPVHGDGVPVLDCGVQLTADVLDRLADPGQQRLEAWEQRLDRHACRVYGDARGGRTARGAISARPSSSAPPLGSRKYREACVPPRRRCSSAASARCSSARRSRTRCSRRRDRVAWCCCGCCCRRSCSPVARPRLRGRTRADLAAVLAYGLILGSDELVVLRGAGPAAARRRGDDRVHRAARCRGRRIASAAGRAVGRPCRRRGWTARVTRRSAWRHRPRRAARTGRRDVLGGLHPDLQTGRRAFARWRGSRSARCASARWSRCPAGIIEGGAALGRPAVLAGGLAVAVLSSALPYSLELIALRRLTAAAFGLLMSIEPAVAALAGRDCAAQPITSVLLIALVMVMVASAGTTLVHRRSAPDRVDISAGPQ